MTVLAELGERDELATLAAAGDVQARSALAKLLAAQRDAPSLTVLADSIGDSLASSSARKALAHLLAERDDIEELRRRAARGDDCAATVLRPTFPGGLRPDGSPE